MCAHAAALPLRTRQVLLIALLVAVPLRLEWRLSRQVGLGLLGFYAASQVVFLLAEGAVL